MNFVALDVETANPDLSSICQIGIVRFVDGVVVDTWEQLVDPQDDFYPWNVMVHGITESRVKGAPRWEDLCDEVCARIGDQVVVSHTSFDRRSIRSAFSKCNYDLPVMRWVDSASVVRRTWSDLARSGYGLSNVAARLGIQFHHHNAAEDARAAGEVLVRAIRHSGVPIHDWIGKASSPTGGAVTRSHSSQWPDKTAVRPVSDTEGPLFGETVVFTGSLGIPRKEAAEIASEAGCCVGNGVTKSTTILVVGDQDLRQLAGADKSRSHRAAEAAQLKGQPIRIMNETDFLAILCSEA